MQEAAFFVGIGKIHFRFRNASKRQVFESLMTKMRNKGFSVIQAGDKKDTKTGYLGFSYSAESAAKVEDAFSHLSPLLIGEFEILSKAREILDFTEMDIKLENLSEELDWKYDED